MLMKFQNTVVMCTHGTECDVVTAVHANVKVRSFNGIAQSISMNQLLLNLNQLIIGVPNEDYNWNQVNYCKWKGILMFYHLIWFYMLYELYGCIMLYHVVCAVVSLLPRSTVELQEAFESDGVLHLFWAGRELPQDELKLCQPFNWIRLDKHASHIFTIDVRWC